MNTFKAISLALLAGGVLLFSLGVIAASPSTSGTSGIVTSMGTNDALWMLVGGAIASLAGLAGLISRTRHA